MPLTSVSPQDFDIRLKAVATETDQLLDRLLPATAGDRLREALRYAVLGPGKRLRPFLVLEAAHLFPVSELSYPESPIPVSATIKRLIERLEAGRPLRILAWGDSVTDGSYLADKDKERWQEQFVARLRTRFPKARIELVTQAWGGRNTGNGSGAIRNKDISEEDREKLKPVWLDLACDLRRCIARANSQIIPDPAKLSDSLAKMGAALVGLETANATALTPEVKEKYRDLLNAYPAMKEEYKKRGGKAFLEDNAGN